MRPPKVSRFVTGINLLCTEILLPSEQLYQLFGFGYTPSPEHNINTLSIREDLVQGHFDDFGTNNWAKTN